MNRLLPTASHLQTSDRLLDRLFSWRDITAGPSIPPRWTYLEYLTPRRRHRNSHSPPAFIFAGQPEHSFDPFHNGHQLVQLRVEIPITELAALPLPRDILLRLSDTIDEKETDRILVTWRDQDLLGGVRQRQQAVNEARQLELHLGKIGANKLHQIRVAERAAPLLKRLLEVEKVSKKEIGHLLGLTPSMTRYCIGFVQDPMKYLEERAGLLEKLDSCRQRTADFLRFFGRNQLRLRTRLELWKGFAATRPDIPVGSLTSFDRRLLRPNRLTRQKVKAVQGRRRPEERHECRLRTVRQLLFSIEAGHSVFFFDETTFDVSSMAEYAYGFSGVRPQGEIVRTNAFLRVLMVTSLTQVEMFHLTTSKVTTNTIEVFLEAFWMARTLEPKFDSAPTVLVLDNAPKNRTEVIKDLARHRKINLLFTVPCSPFLNCIESVFGILKRRIRRRPEYPFQ